MVQLRARVVHQRQRRRRCPSGAKAPIRAAHEMCARQKRRAQAGRAAQLAVLQDRVAGLEELCEAQEEQCFCLCLWCRAIGATAAAAAGAALQLASTLMLLCASEQARASTSTGTITSASRQHTALPVSLALGSFGAFNALLW